MLASAKMQSVRDLISDFSSEELFWLNGYIEGRLSTNSNQKSLGPVKAAVNKITITYGTETGNSKKLASEFAAKAKKSGINAKVVSLDQYRLNDLSKVEYFLSIIS